VAFILRVIEGLGKNNAGDMAASIAYYSILAVFPLILGIIAVLGLLLPSETVQKYLFDFFDQYFPNSLQLIKDNVDMVVKMRGPLGIFSILGLFWTGSAIFEALGRVANSAWRIYTPKPYFIRKFKILLMSFSTGIIFLLSMATNTISSLINQYSLPVADSLTSAVVRTLSLILLFLIFAMMFKFLPNTKTYWRYIWPGAILTTVIFEIARTAFVYYLANFANYDQVYGSLATIVILLVWVYISAFILIIGTVFTAEYARTRSRISR
jgi:membrane protein